MSATLAPEPTANRTPEGATAVVKFHASMNANDLQRSISFYRALFGKEPSKSYPDYAKFEVDEPPLILSLKPKKAGAGGPVNHMGIRLRSVEEVREVEARLLAAGFKPSRQDDVKCCYAHQTKFWVMDPDEVLWEIYVLFDDHPTWGEGSKAKLMMPPLKAMGVVGMIRRWWANRKTKPAAACASGACGDGPK